MSDTTPCRVNLIPLSPVPEFAGEAPSPGTADAFLAILRRAGVNGTIRESRGKDVRGACGQLRRAARSKGGEGAEGQGPASPVEKLKG